MPEVVFQIEPDLAPVADNADASVGRIEIVTANSISLRSGVAALVLAQMVKHRPWKPMHMAVEDSHRTASRNTRVAVASALLLLYGMTL
jgi:hypothetical protein